MRFSGKRQKKIAPVFQAGVAGVEKGMGKEAKERGDWGEKETALSFALSQPPLANTAAKRNAHEHKI